MNEDNSAAGYVFGKAHAHDCDGATPRTDAVQAGNSGYDAVESGEYVDEYISLCRQLERDLAAANERIESLRVELAACRVRMGDERDTIRDLNDELCRSLQANKELQAKLDRAVKCIAGQLACAAASPDDSCRQCEWWAPGISCTLSDEAKAIVEGK
jgi:chromosome segregation ATPase